MRIGGLHLFGWTSAGELRLASYHPRTSSTWHWSIVLQHDRLGLAPYRARHRSGQWHDYYPLPFGWQLIVGQQDWHKAPAA